MDELVDGDALPLSKIGAGVQAPLTDLINDQRIRSFMKLLHARRHLYWLSEEVAAYRQRSTYQIVRADNQGEATNPRTWAQLCQRSRNSPAVGV